MRRVCVRHVCGRLVSVQVGGLPLYLAVRNVARRGPPSGLGARRYSPAACPLGPPRCGPPPPRCPLGPCARVGRSRAHCPRSIVALAFASASLGRCLVAAAVSSGECGGGSSGTRGTTLRGVGGAGCVRRARSAPALRLRPRPGAAARPRGLQGKSPCPPLGRAGGFCLALLFRE
jgi:hypothetical protein